MTVDMDPINMGDDIFWGYGNDDEMSFSRRPGGDRNVMLSRRRCSLFFPLSREEQSNRSLENKSRRKAQGGR